LKVDFAILNLVRKAHGQTLVKRWAEMTSSKMAAGCSVFLGADITAEMMG